MDILDKIVAHKREEVAGRKALVSVKELERAEYFSRDTFSLREFLLRPDKSGIIAEFKRRSPSKGDINPRVGVEEVTTGYTKAGASGLSVLTDTHFFGGSQADLLQARRYNDIPVLRKEFIIDPYQILEAKAMGADAILLIAECLAAGEVKSLAATAKGLGLEVLLEVHSREQMAKITPDIDVLGVNNRNLKNFTVSIQTSVELFEHIPSELVRISESGINDPQAIVLLQEVGFQGFLIGEYFMMDENPGMKCFKFIREIESLREAALKSSNQNRKA